MGSSGMGSAFWAAAALLPLVLAYEVKEDEYAHARLPGHGYDLHKEYPSLNNLPYSVDATRLPGGSKALRAGGFFTVQACFSCVRFSIIAPREHAFSVLFKYTWRVVMLLCLMFLNVSAVAPCTFVMIFSLV